MMGSVPPPAVEMHNIIKRFPGVVANDHASLTVRSGEIHALLGENGAGKSTLMNILAGLYRPEEGEIRIHGQPVDINSPRDATRLGIGMVHQHFRLVETQTVAENTILGMSEEKSTPNRFLYTWLILMLFGNCFAVLANLFHLFIDRAAFPLAPAWVLAVFAVMNLVNIAGIIGIWKSKNWALPTLVGSVGVALVINLITAGPSSEVLAGYIGVSTASLGHHMTNLVGNGNALPGLAGIVILAILRYYPGSHLDMPSVEAEIRELSARYGLQVDPSTYIWQFSVGEQQRVEILKMLYRGADILILDEPTAVLTPQESEELGNTLRQMADEGKAVIFITHKLNEVMAFSDRVTVLRRGQTAVTLTTAQTTKQDLARHMVGRNVVFQIDRAAYRVDDKVLQAARPMLVVNDLCTLNDKGLQALRDISFTVHQYEILGMAGVAGNGQRELAEVITGLRPVTSGQVLLGTSDVTNKHPGDVIDLGLSHIPEDRMQTGLVANMTVSDNLILKDYRRPPLSRLGFLVKTALQNFANRLIAEFDIATPSQSTMVKNLSGGNLQKAILAREITAGGDLMVAVHPTRGLDIGATEWVQRRLLEQRQKGAAILLISEDLDELLAVSDRIAVIYEGHIIGIVSGHDADVDEIGLMMAGTAVDVIRDSKGKVA